ARIPPGPGARVQCVASLPARAVDAAAASDEEPPRALSAPPPPCEPPQLVPATAIPLDARLPVRPAGVAAPPASQRPAGPFVPGPKPRRNALRNWNEWPSRAL